MTLSLPKSAILVAIFAFATVSHATLPVTIRSVDYLNNVTATNAAWFQQPSQHFPSVEQDNVNNITDIVYRRGTTFQVTFTFYNPNNAVATGTWSFINPRLRNSPAPLDYISLSGGQPGESITIPALSTTSKTVTISGLPNTVWFGDFEGQLSILTNFGGVNSMAPAYMATFYIVDEQPLGQQQIPWIEILRLSCYFAKGETGATDVVDELTVDFHYWDRLIYDYSAPIYYIFAPTNGTYDLSLLAADLGISISYITMDCQDVSGCLYLMAASQGHDSTPIRLYNSSSGFYTNPVIGAGAGSAAQFGFNFHQPLLANGYISDSAIRFTRNLSNVVGDVVATNSPWTTQGYFQTATGGSPTFVGLAFGFSTMTAATVTLSSLNKPIVGIV